MMVLSIDDEILECDECDPDGFVCEYHSKIIEKDLTEYVKKEIEKLKKL